MWHQFTGRIDEGQLTRVPISHRLMSALTLVTGWLQSRFIVQTGQARAEPVNLVGTPWFLTLVGL